MSSPKPASTPGWQLCPPCPQEPCREHPRAPLRGHCVSLGLVTDGVTPTCAVPLLPRRQASLKNILPPFPSLQTAQWRWNHSALCVPMFFFSPMKPWEVSLSCHSSGCTAVLRTFCHGSSLHQGCLCWVFPSSFARVTSGARRAPSQNLL